MSIVSTKNKPNGPVRFQVSQSEILNQLKKLNKVTNNKEKEPELKELEIKPKINIEQMKLIVDSYEKEIENNIKDIEILSPNINNNSDYSSVKKLNSMKYNKIVSQLNNIFNKKS
jgi:hypothetical protein